MNRTDLRKSIAYLLILLGTALLIIFCTCYLPVIGSLFICVWAIPVIIAIQKNGLAVGIGLSLVAVIATVFLIDYGTALFVFGIMGVLGVFYGVRIKQKNSNPMNTLLCGIVLVLVLAVAVFGILTLTGVLDYVALKTSLETSLHQAFSVYNQSLENSDLAETGTSLKAYENQVIALTLQIVPGLLLSLLVLVAAVNYIAADRYLKKRNFIFHPLPVFREWHFPWWILWGVLISLGLLVLGNGLDNELYVTIAKNIFFCYIPLMLAAGISFTRWLMQHWHLSNGFCVVIWIAAVLFISVSVIFFIITGVADTMFDYRNSFNKSMPKEDI